MRTLRLVLYPALFLTIILLSQSIFVVKETERAVKLRFGEIVEADVPPGLHFKLPIVNTVRKFDASNRGTHRKRHLKSRRGVLVWLAGP